MKAKAWSRARKDNTDMRTTGKWIMLGTALVLSSCSTSVESDLQSKWENPPLEYRMNRNWHDIPMDPAAMDSLIAETLENGWGGLSINVPFKSYLTAEGMEATRVFCDKAKEKELDLWLYDELGYPSGNAGDLVIKTNPDWECMGILMRDTLVTGGEMRFRLPPGDPLMLAAFPLEKGMADYSKPVDLAQNASDHYLNWHAPEGDWQVFAATKDVLFEGFQAEVKGGSKQGARYPSLMIPEVTEAFLNVTHEQYADYLGEDLGTYFTSTFTDEPSTMALQFHHNNMKYALLPWHGILSEETEKRFGFRPEDRLVELYFDEGPAGQEVRYQYFHTVADLMAKNYFGAIREWCEDHHFYSGGHLLLEESMVAHVPLYGDVMKCFREMHAPGIDILSCFPEQMPVHTPKLASSSAELTGHPFVMAEPCPVADRAVLEGKETPASAVRGHLNMLLQGGVTDFNCYLRLSNSDTGEKVAFNTYVGRINLLLQGGQTAAEVGVVYPIESMWTRFRPRYHKVRGWQEVGGALEEVNRIDSCFIDASRTMFDYRWEYLHLDGEALAGARIIKGVLETGPFKFKVLVLPSVNTLPEASWTSVLAFARQGGKIVFLEEMPVNSDKHFPDAAIREAFAGLLSEGSDVVFMEEWTPEGLDGQLAEWLEKPVTLGDESLDVGLAHRRVDGRDVFFLLNDSDRDISTALKLNSKKELEEWDPATGAINRFDNGSMLTLKPYHGKLYRTR